MARGRKPKLRVVLRTTSPSWTPMPPGHPPPPPPPPAPDPNGPVNDGANDDVSRPRDRARVKETDEVTLFQFPQGTAWRACRANTIHAIISAAGRLDALAQEWILNVETHDPSDLEDPGEWVCLPRP